MLGVNEIWTRTFNLTNPNPVKVPIYTIETNLDGLVIKLDSVWNSHGYATAGRGEFSKNRRIIASSLLDASQRYHNASLLFSPLSSSPHSPPPQHLTDLNSLRTLLFLYWNPGIVPYLP